MPKAKAGERQAALDLSASSRSTIRTYEPFVPGPNPKLQEFIREHATHYDPVSDRYNVPAFQRDLVVDKATPPKAIYDMHGYWSKKHWAAIREYIRHYLPEKYYPRGTGVVLDCFSGSGMTGVAAMMEDRPCVLADASPAAAYISHCYTHPVDPEDMQTAYERMLLDPYPTEIRAKSRRATGQDIRNLKEELDWLYSTKCDRCGGDATTDYVVYSERFQCPNCAELIALFDCPDEKVPYAVGGRKSGSTELKKRTVCPHCLSRSHGKPSRDFVISTRSQKFGAVPVLVKYRCEAGCRPAADERRHDENKRSRKGKFFAEHDLEKLEHIKRANIPHWYPERKMMDMADDSQPWGVEWRPGRDFRNIAALYNKRNLWALAAIKAAIDRATETHPLTQAWYVALTAVCLNASRMYRFRPSGKGGIKNGSYYLPQLSQIMRVSAQFADKRKDVVEAEKALYQMQEGPVIVSNINAKERSVPAETVDYAFTDPAYVDKVQYGELNFIWESWLGFDGSWLKEEIVVNPFRNRTIDDWERDLRQALANIFQALKPGRWLSLCYHDTDPATWARVQNMLLDSGFEIHTVTVLDPIQKSSNQLTAEMVAKGDLVVNCLKPRSGKDRRAERDEVGIVSGRVRDIVVDVLGQSGGQLREHLWDVVLKRLLTRGQLAAHRFDDVLAEVALKSESGRWFLKEEFESLSENDLKNEEEAGEGITAFATLRMAGIPVAFAAEIVLHAPQFVSRDVEEGAIERYIRQNLLKGHADADKFKLGGRVKGVEFYDCLFFYLTRWLKGRAGGRTPRRNLAEFLDEYLVRFRESDKWLYRVPDDSEASSLRKARQTGLGRRIRRYVAYLRGEGDYLEQRKPDVKTLCTWLKHCATFGLADEGVALFERGGLAAQLGILNEDLRYDAEDYYAQCRRRVGHAGATKSEEDEQDPQGDEE